MELLIFCLLVILSLLSYRQNKWGLWPICLALIAIVGLRDISVGTDTTNYSLYFHILKNGGTVESEYLYSFLNKLVIYLGGEYFWVQLLSAALTIVPIFLVISKKSPYPYLSIFLYITLYIYFYSFNIVRQCIAISLCFLALSLFQKNKLLYFAIIIAAINFHASAMVMVPLYFVNRIKLEGTKMAALLAVTFITGIFLPTYILNVGSLFGYSNYLTGNFSLGSLIGNMFYLILLNTVFFVAYWFERDKANALFGLFFIFLVVSNLLIRFPFGNRIILYLSIFQIIYFPSLLSRLSKKQRSLMFMLIVIYAIFSFYISYGNGEVFPYRSIIR